MQAITNFEGDLAKDSYRIKFLYTTKDHTIEEIFTCNKLLYYLNDTDEDNLIEWKFKVIIVYKGSLSKLHSNYNSSPYNLRIE